MFETNGILNEEMLKAVVIPCFLDEAERKQIYDYQGKLANTVFTTGAGVQYVGYDMELSPSHVCLNVHTRNYFERLSPVLYDKIVDTMHAQIGKWHQPAFDLNVRCMELHTYTAGDGLMTEGHRDNGSVLSMSILLSCSHTGGSLMTYDGEGLPPTYHDMHQGDALVFHSDKRHNVSPITNGVRHSFVTELWMGPKNKHNRNR